MHYCHIGRINVISSRIIGLGLCRCPSLIFLWDRGQQIRDELNPEKGQVDGSGRGNKHDRYRVQDPESGCKDQQERTRKGH